MKLRKYIFLATLPLLLAGCGDEKKVDMNISGSPSGTSAQSIISPEPTQTLNPEWVAEFGTTLAAFQSIDWDDEFTVTKDNKSVTVKINAKTRINDHKINSIFETKLYKNNADDKFRVINAYLGNRTVYILDEGYAPKSYYEDLIEQNNIEMSEIKSQLALAESNHLSEQKKKDLEEVLAGLASENDLLSALATKAPTDWTEADNYSYNSYMSSDGTHRTELIFNEADGHLNFGVTGYVPSGITINDSEENHRKIIDDIISQLNLVPSTKGESYNYNIGVNPCSSYSLYAKFTEDTDSSSLFLDNQSTYSSNPILNPMAYSFTFMKDSVSFYVHMPTSITNAIDNVSLLSFSEIKNIAKAYIEDIVKENAFVEEIQEDLDFPVYNSSAFGYLFPLKNGTLNVKRADLVFVYDREKEAVCPAWKISAKANGLYDEICLLKVNAIDGSIIK